MLDIPDYTICTRCIYDVNVPNMEFDEDGVCNYCRQVDDMKALFGTGLPKGAELLNNIIADIKRRGNGKKYDCIVGVSGGTDSSFLLMRAKDWGLRPLAVHYDNTWNTAVATENIRKITSALNVDLYTHVLDNKEADDLYRSFFLAGSQEFDAPTDMALVQTIRSAAAKFRVSYILEGHSFVAEGISPLGSAYVDGGYIADVHRKYGRLKLKTFPNLTFWQFLKWVTFYNQKFIRPLWYIDYSKEEAKKELTKRTGWMDYGGHHLENRASAFGHTVNRPLRFNQDLRNLTLAARARTGLITREDAISEYRTPIVPDLQLIQYMKKRLELSDVEYDRAFTLQKRTFRDFRNYKKRFELMRPIFYFLAKRNKVTMSFYLKYCFPLPEKK
jgi:hypothetical protein